MDILKIIFLILVVISLVIFIGYSIFTFYYILSKKKNEMSDNEYQEKLKKVGITNVIILIVVVLVTIVYTLIPWSIIKGYSSIDLIKFDTKHT